MKIVLRLFVTVFVGMGLDFVTKIWAENNLAPFQPVEIMGNFARFTLGYNTGVAFGMFTGRANITLIITGVVIVFLLIWFSYGLYTGRFPAYTVWSIGLLLGGAISNFLDRLHDGQVTDFIDLGLANWRWPTFNIADTFILTGVGLLVLFTFFEKEEEDISPHFDNSSTDSSTVASS